MTAENKPDEKFGIEDLIKKIGRSEALKFILTGKLSSKGIFTEKDVVGFKCDLKQIVAPQKEAKPKKSKKTYGQGEIYVVLIENPAKKLQYLTIMQNGRIDVTYNENGDIDWDSFEEKGLTGYQSLQDLFKETFSDVSLPLPEKRKKSKSGKKRKNGNTEKKKDKPNRAETFYFIDPALKKLLGDKKDFFSYSAFAHNERKDSKTATLTERDELTDLLQEGTGVVDNAVRGGYRVALQEINNFIVHNRAAAAIIDARKRKLKELVRRKDIGEVVSRYYDLIDAEVGINPLELDKTKRVEYLANASNGRFGYQFFSKKENKLDGISIEDMIDSLGEITKEGLISAPMEKAHAIQTSMCHWIAIAKAAQYVRDNEYISKKVVPLFERANQNLDKETMTETVYEGMRQLLKKITDKRLHFTIPELDFVLNGLWYAGYFKKDVRAKENGDTEENGLEEEAKKDPIFRENRGVKTQWIYPAKHFMQRPEYSDVLDSSFEDLLSRGRISKDLEIGTYTKDRKFGQLVYGNIPEDKKAIFVSIQDEKPLSTSDGGVLSHILGIYVGINREKILEKVADHWKSS